MTERDNGKQRIRLTVGDGVTSFGDVNTSDWRVAVEGADGLLARAGGDFIEVDVAPGTYYTTTGVPTWTKGATRFNVSRAAVFVPMASAPPANSDALIMHVQGGTDDFEWIGGQMLSPMVPQAELRSERVGIRVACNRARVVDITARFDASPVPVSTMNIESFFVVGIGPAHQASPDLMDVPGVNNCTVENITVNGESSGVTTGFGGRCGAVRGRKAAHLKIRNCIAGAPWHETNPTALTSFQMLALVMLEDCYAPDVEIKLGPDVYGDCFARSVVTEPHFDFTQPWVEAGHSLWKVYCHTTTFQNAGIDLRDGGFSSVSRDTLMGQVICPSHSLPIIWARPGTHTAVAIDVAAGNIAVGDALRFQDGDGGDVTLTAVASNPNSNQFAVGGSASASIDNLKAAIRAKWVAGSLRMFARKTDLGGGAFRATVAAVGRAGRPPAAMTITKTSGGANVTIVTTASRPFRGVDIDVAGTYHWASDGVGTFNHPAIRVDKYCGRTGIDAKIDHVRELDPAWNAAQKRANMPIVLTDCTFIDGRASARPFVASDYDLNGVFQDSIASFTAGREPHLYSIVRTESRITRGMLQPNVAFGNFAGLWTSDGTVDGTMIEEGHNYVNGSVTAST